MPHAPRDDACRRPEGRPAAASNYRLEIANRLSAQARPDEYLACISRTDSQNPSGFEASRQPPKGVGSLVIFKIKEKKIEKNYSFFAIVTITSLTVSTSTFAPSSM